MFAHIALKSISCIGLDIKPDEIRLLHLSKAKEKLTLENFAIAKLPPEAIVDGKIKQPDIVQAILNRLVRTTKTQHYLTAIGLPAQNVICKRVKLPAMLNAIEREVEISTNLGRYLPDITEKLSFDFVMLNPLDDEHHEILLVAARREQLNAYSALAAQAGLNVKIVDVDIYGLTHALLSVLPMEIKSTVAIFHIDASGCQFIVSQQGQVIFYQAWQLAGQDFIEAQLKRALMICLSRFRQLPLQDLILSGHVFLTDTFLQRDFSLRTHTVHPLLNIQVVATINASHLQSNLANLITSCGLAMRGMAHVRN